MPVGRLHYEITGDFSKLDQSIRQAYENVTAFDGKMNATGKRFVASFQEMLNPTENMAKELDLLTKAGYDNAQIWGLMGERWKAGIAQAEKFGQAVPAAMKAFANEAQGIDRTNEVFARFGQTLAGLAQNPLQAARTGLTGLVSALGPAAVGIAGVATAAVAGGVAIAKMGMDAADAAEQISNLALSTGMTVEDVQALQRLGEETGVGDLTSRIEQLNIQLGREEGGEFTQAILRMGIAIKESAGAVYYLEEMRKKYAEIPTETKRAEQAAADLGRRLFHELAPLVLNTSQSITEAMADIKGSGAVMTSEQMENMRALDSEIDEHGRAWVWLKNQVKIATSEATLLFVKMVEAMLGSMPSNADEWKEYAGEGEWTGSVGTQEWEGSYGVYGKPEREDPLAARQAAIARADAVAAGTRKELLDLTVKLKQAEAEYQAEKKKAQGLEQYDQKRVDALAQEIAGIKQAIEARQKQYQEAEKARAAEEKRAKEARDLQDLLNDDTKLYGDILLPAAAKAWEKIKNEGIGDAAIRFKELYDLTQRWVDSYNELDKLQPREPWTLPPEQGQTFEDLKKAGNEAINKTIPEVVMANKRGSEEIADVWRNQVSTIVTDWSRGIADIIVEGGNLGQRLKDIFKETAKSLLRILIESLFNPLKQAFAELGSWIGRTLFGLGGSSGGGGGIFGSIGQSLLGGAGSLAGMFLPIGLGAGIGATTTGGSPWGTLAGAGTSVFAAGGMSALGTGALTGGWLGEGIGGFLGGGAHAMWAMVSNPITLAVAGALIGGIAIYKYLKDPLRLAGKEAGRDFGVEMSKSTWDQFTKGLGFTDKSQWEGIRKDLMSSPLWLATIGAPAAKAAGTYESVFLPSLERVGTDWGTFNFREAFELGDTTGDWSLLNKQFIDAFGISQRLNAALPDWTSKLTMANTSAENLVENLDADTAGFTSLLEAIQGTIPAAEDMYQVFWKTGEILPELADAITKYGGNLSVFEDYAATVPKLRSDLSAITELIQGLDALAPEEGVIQRILAGKGFGEGGWEELVSLGLDPSKLVNLADLITFKTGWEQARGEYESTGKLVKGGLMEQALWRFGGEAGAKALDLYGKGFNTITPGLLDTVGQNIATEFERERETVLPYLQGAADSINDRITTATNAVVTELKNILAAIQAGFAGSTVTPKAEGAASGAEQPPPGEDEFYYDPRTGRYVNRYTGQAEPIGAPTNPRAGEAVEIPGTGQVVRREGVYIDMRGATVYGYEDFDRRVNQAWLSNYRRGGYPQLAAAPSSPR